MTFVVERVRHRTPPAPRPAPPPPVAKPMTADEIAAAIATIKLRARRLRPPLRLYPNAFHEDKSEMVRDLEQLEDAVRKGLPLPERLK